jgi:hypothetical protein
VEIIEWLIVPSLILGLLIWWPGQQEMRSAVKSRWQVLLGRRLGTYHHFLSGGNLASGEGEVFRTEVRSVSIYSVDRHTEIDRRSTCILTEQRLMVCGPKGNVVQIPLHSIRSAHTCRDYDPRLGFSYWATINRIGSTDHDPHGDICLGCESNQQSHALISHIQDALVR